MADIIFRTIEENDIPEVNKFYNNYHHSGRTQDLFRWEFQENPHGKGIYCLAVVAETGQIIGIQAGIPILCLTAADEKVLTIKSEDTLIDLDLCAALKKKNLFSELYAFFVDQCRESGASCIWGFTWVKNSLKRIGFQIPFDAGQGLLVFHPFKSFRYLSGLNIKNTLPDKIKIAVLVATSWIKGWKSRCSCPMATLTMKEGIYPNVGLFHESAKEYPDLLFMQQDAAFSDWRLQKNPYPLKYSILNFFNKDQLVSQIITSIHPNGQGYLEQLLMAPGFSAATYKKTIKAAVKHLFLQGAIHIRVLTFEGNQVNRQQMDLLKSTGFFIIKKGMGFIFLPLGGCPAIRPEQFLLSRIYTQGHN